MLKLMHVTNGVGKVSVVVAKGNERLTIALDADEAVDLAAQLLIKARNLQEGKHDSGREARVITTKGVLYGDAGKGGD